MRPELVQAAELLRRSDRESVERAIALLQNTVFSFSMKMCGHREDAEDTMQDVLAGSVKHLSKLEQPEALAAWLYTVTRNRCHRMRRKPAGAELPQLSLDELMPDEVELQRLLQSHDKTPEKNLLLAEQNKLLQQAVLHVPVPLRLVLVLHDMEELTSEEVAKILGLQVGTVRVRLHRARLAVRKEMARLEQGISANGKSTANKPLKRPRSCCAIFASLSEYLDERLEKKHSEQMRAHIEDCPACVAFLKDLRTAIDRCRALPAECDSALAGRMRKQMTEEYLRTMQVPVGKN